MPSKRSRACDLRKVLSKAKHGKTQRTYADGQLIFRQGDEADAVFYLQDGRIKLVMLSQGGKEAVIAILERGSFFGEGCLAGQIRRTSNAMALGRVRLMRIEKKAMIRLLHEQPDFEDSFLGHLIARNIRAEEDLADHIFNSSEKRLARVLLLLSHFGTKSKPEPLVPRVSQETLAAMVGTTRSRVSYFMNKFKRLGFINYDNGLQVNRSLLNVVLHD